MRLTPLCVIDHRSLLPAHYAGLKSPPAKDDSNGTSAWIARLPVCRRKPMTFSLRKKALLEGGGWANDIQADEGRNGP